MFVDTPAAPAALRLSPTPRSRETFAPARRGVSQAPSVSLPTTATRENPSLVRSLFISDIHLGCKHSQAGALVELLDRFEPQQVYLVGDFIDGWKLKGKWRWRPEYDAVLRRLMAMRRAGAQLFYTPGNHDSFLRGFLANFGVVEVQDRFIHTAADGRRYIVTHGDQFDRIEQSCQWLSLVASYAYDALLTANWAVNRLRGKKHDPYAFCGAVKQRVKRLVKHVSEFEGQLVDDARNSDCDGVICGHIHAPRIESIDQIAYLNTGDWVENCTALIELEDGRFELIRQDGELLDRLPARPTAARPPVLATANAG